MFDTSFSLKSIFNNILKVIFILLTIIYCLNDLVEAIKDQTRFHTQAFKYHFNSTIKVLFHYIKSIFRYYYIHFFHRVYLYKLGINDRHPNLMDTGVLEVKTQELEGKCNMIGKSTNDRKPADQVVGLINNISGNPASMCLASLSVEELWKILGNLPNFDFKDSSFIGNIYIYIYIYLYHKLYSNYYSI
jgi:hypothetical protein